NRRTHVRYTQRLATFNKTKQYWKRSGTPLNSSLIQLHLQTRHFAKKKSTPTSPIDVRIRVEENFGLRNLVHRGKWGIMFSLRLKDFCLAWEASCVHWPLRWAPPDPLQQQTGPDNLTPFNKASFSFSFSFSISRASRGFRRPVRSRARAAAKFSQSLMKLLSADDVVELIREPLWPI
ncbi:unnamed protein product, partial [Heterotrigona itama]